MIDLEDLLLEEEEEEEEDDEEYEDEYDEEASDEDDEEGADDVSEETSVKVGEEDEWGFGEKKKSRFSKEVLLGFTAITLLCGIFGIVVWKNLNSGEDAEETANNEQESSLGSELGEEGELGQEGELNEEGVDPFATDNTGQERIASNPDLNINNGLQNDENGNPFSANGEGEMGTFENEESSGEFLGQNREPEIQIGENNAEEVLDPFGRPINSEATGAESLTSTETEFGSTGNSEFGSERLGTATLGSTEIGIDIGRESLGSETLGSETLGSEFGPSRDSIGTGSEIGESSLTRPDFGSTETLGSTETGSLDSLGLETGNSLNGQEPIGLFDHGNTESPGSSEATEEINPFGRTETTQRTDEFGRPVDAFGRPIESSTTESTLGSDTLIGSAETETTLSGTPGFESESSDIGTSTEIGSQSLGSDTTSLFPDETSTGTTEIEEQPTGLFDSSPSINADNRIAEPEVGGELPGGTPGFETETTETLDGNTFLEPRTEGAGTLPRESAFPSDTGTSSGTTFEPELSTNLDHGDSLPSVNSIDSRPFGSTDSTTIVGGYPVKSGDSYWTISKKVYGTARYFRVLAEYNSKAVPDPAKLRPGMTIQTPGEATLKQMLLANSSKSAGSAVARRPVGSPPVTPEAGIFFNENNQPMFRVGKSDTLTTIAADHLGRWARWRQVYEMNRDQLDNPNKLQIGMVLKLPADASRTAMSKREGQIR